MLGNWALMANFASVVKFDNQEQLPPILNALETDNGGNKLVLEVAVRITIHKSTFNVGN